MRDTDKKRKSAVTRYITAFTIFQKNPDMSWDQCLKEARCGKSYPFMDLSKLPRLTDQRLAVSDLIGFYNRMKKSPAQNAVFIETVSGILLGVRVKTGDIASFSDIELVREVQKRGIQQDEVGEYFKLEINKIPIRFDF